MGPLDLHVALSWHLNSSYSIGRTFGFLIDVLKLEGKAQPFLPFSN